MGSEQLIEYVDVVADENPLTLQQQNRISSERLQVGEVKFNFRNIFVRLGRKKQDLNRVVSTEIKNKKYKV